MRLWSVHPSLLDQKALVAVWREGLLAQAVLRGRTRGYRKHPQLRRFRTAPRPLAAIADFLRGLHAEADRRGYHFDQSKISRARGADLIPVHRGQLVFEWDHLRRKLDARNPAWLQQVGFRKLRAHPLFKVIAGDIEEWEAGPNAG